MPATFFLAADHRALDLDAVRALLGASRVRETWACYIGAAHDDDRSFAERSRAKLASGLGLRCEAPRLSDPALEVDAARRAILGASLLVLDGGDTVGLVAHARARGLHEAFAAAARGAIVVAGVSAGSCAVAPVTIGYDEDERALASPCFAMGVAEPLDVHSEDDDWAEMRLLLEAVAGRPGLAQSGIVIPSGSALVVDALGRMSSHGRQLCERRSLGARGAWSIERIARAAAG